jgi:hypothetical protein
VQKEITSQYKQTEGKSMKTAVFLPSGQVQGRQQVAQIPTFLWLDNYEPS